MRADKPQAYSGLPVICGQVNRNDRLRWFANRQIRNHPAKPSNDAGHSSISLGPWHFVRSLAAESPDTARDGDELPLHEIIETGEAERNPNNTSSDL